jgi:PHD-finger
MVSVLHHFQVLQLSANNSTLNIVFQSHRSSSRSWLNAMNLLWQRRKWFQTLLIVCDHVKRAPNGVLRTFQPICAPVGISDANLSTEAVRCDSCKKFYHMGCVQPPLAAKPAKGYGWTCAPCSRKREEKVDRQGAHSESPPRSIKGRTKSKLQQPTGNSNGSGRRNGGEEVHYFKMWPFRYFGYVCLRQDLSEPPLNDDIDFTRMPRIP